MKKALIRALSVVSAFGMIFAISGCGQKTEVVSEIQTTTVSGTQGTYVSGTQGTDGTQTPNGNNNSVTSGGFGKVDNGQSALSTAGGTDLKGKTIVIAKWDNSAAPVKSSSTYQKETELVAAIEKKYNCKIKFAGQGGSMEYFRNMVQEMQSGKSSADIVYLPGDMAFPSTALNGYFTQLEGLIDLKNLQWNQSAVNNALVLNGKHYFVSPSINTGTLAGTGVFFNKKLFASANVSTPEEYVKNNNWNWDTFKEVARKMTSNGVYGIASYSSNNYGTTFALTSNGVRPVLNQGNKHTLNLNSPAAIAAITFSGELESNKWIAKGNTNFTNGKAAMVFSAYTEGDDYIKALGKGTVGFTYLPMGPNVKDYSEVYVGTSVEVIGIPTNTHSGCDKKVLAQIMTDFTAPYSWRKTAEQALENYFDDAASLQRAVKTAEYAYAKLDFQPYYGKDVTDNIFWGSYGIPGTSAQAYVASIQGKAQEAINNIWAGKGAQ